MKRIVYVWVLSMLCVLSSCSYLVGDGTVVEETRELVADFNELQVEGSMKVYVDYSPTSYVKVVAESNLMPNIITHLSHHRLTVRIKGPILSIFPIEVYVYSPEYSDIEKSGSGSMILRDVRSRSLYITLSGSGDTWIEGPEDESQAEPAVRSPRFVPESGVAVESDTVPSVQRASVHATDETDIKIIRQASQGFAISNEYLNIHLQGSGSLTCRRPVYADEFELNVKGSGSASVDVSSPKAFAIVEGSGNMDMHINAKMLIASIYGSGKMVASGDLTTLDLLIEGSGSFSGYNLDSKVGIVQVEGSGDAYVHVDDVLYAKGSGSGHICYQGYPVISKEGGIRLRDKN